VDCEYVLVDYDLVLKAPAHLNTAGLGDILCNYAKIAEWRRNTKLGVGPPCDEAVASAVLQFHHGITDSFRASLDDAGNLTADSIRVIMTAVQARDERERALSTAASSGDHDFAFALELLCDRGWIHGELVALGAVIIAWHCDEDPLSLLSRLDTCLVWYRPSQLGISRDQLRRALEFIPEYMADPVRGGGNKSILRQVPLVGHKFDELWAFLGND
jgi:glycerol dehydrogenase-like iron-containing ADH family enzyme